MGKNRTGYNGFSSSSEFLTMSWDEFLEYSLGRMARSFINNKFEQELRGVLSMAIAWGMYNDKGI